MSLADNLLKRGPPRASNSSSSSMSSWRTRRNFRSLLFGQTIKVAKLFLISISFSLPCTTLDTRTSRGDAADRKNGISDPKVGRFTEPLGCMLLKISYGDYCGYVTTVTASVSSADVCQRAEFQLHLLRLIPSADLTLTPPIGVSRKQFEEFNVRTRSSFFLSRHSNSRIWRIDDPVFDSRVFYIGLAPSKWHVLTRRLK